MGAMSDLESCAGLVAACACLCEYCCNTCKDCSVLAVLWKQEVCQAIQLDTGICMHGEVITLLVR